MPHEPSGPFAYLNGQFLPGTEARLPFHDAGFVWGATVSDLCRTFRHQLFRLQDHFARFRQSCEWARIPQPRSNSELVGIAEQLVARNATLLRPEQELALVMFATPGPIGYQAGQAGEGPPTLCMYTFILPFDRYRPYLERGIHLVVPATRQVPASSVDPRIKQRSRLHWWLAQQETRATDPAAMALLLDAQGHVTETASANLLVVRQGTVLSPPRTTILPGVTLRVVEELCGELALPFEERCLTVEDCRTADEAFLSCTTFCLAGVSQLNATPLSCPGPVFERLLEAFGNRVGVGIRQQICSGFLT
jgi:branched-chain amino acid aminotransferase